MHEVVLYRLAQAVLVLIPVTICASRLHAHPIEAVDATQELTRCARLVGAVVGRRNTQPGAPIIRGATRSAPRDPERPTR
jgi:hypothetical protein